MNEQLIKYAFTKDELEKYAGLFSFLKFTALKNLVKFIVSAIKKLVTWALITYGVTTISDIYNKAKDNPTTLMDKHEWKAWNSDEGPFENILRIATYAMPAFGGLFGGTIGLVLDKFLSKNYGMGIEDLGKFLDRKLNLSPETKINENNLDSLGLENAISGIFSMASFASMKDLKKIYGIQEN